MISLFHAVLILVISLIAWKFIQRRKLGKTPPGPSPLPLLGNVVSLGKVPHLAFNKWADQYGKIYQVYIGSQRNIVLSDHELIQKAFQSPSFAGRPRMEVLEFDGTSHGIILNSGQEWQDQRRFTLRHLRNFGFGKNYMEGLVLEEVKELIDWLKSQEGKSVSLNKKFTLAVINSLWRIITGKRFSQTDPKLEGIFNQLFEAGRDINLMMVLFMPGLARMIPNLSGWNKIREVVKAKEDLIMEPINEHKKEFSPDIQEHPRDFIDAYLGEMHKTTQPASSFYGSLGDVSLTAVILDLFQAGSLTTSTTLTWGVLYLVLHPDVQKKIQKEIDEVVGSSRPPSLLDRPQMIYTEAVMLETLRKSSVVPMGAFHTATEDTSFEGYDVPKGTGIIPNQYYLHHDVKAWGDPENFRPERFISSEGKIQMKEKLVAFSVGRRVCIGDTVARDEIFLFLTSLFQRFEIQADPKKAKPSMEPVPIFDALEPQEFFITVKDRNNE